MVAMAQARLREAERFLSAFKDNERKTLHVKVEERVKAPGLNAVAWDLYELLSFEAHNDVTALERRHRIGNGVVFGRANPSGTIDALHTAVFALALAIRRVHEFTTASAVEAETTFNLIQGSMEAIRREWRATSGMHK
jgi:hypothetical protein